MNHVFTRVNHRYSSGFRFCVYPLGVSVAPKPNRQTNRKKLHDWSPSFIHMLPIKRCHASINVGLSRCREQTRCRSVYLWAAAGTEGSSALVSAGSVLGPGWRTADSSETKQTNTKSFSCRLQTHKPWSSRVCASETSGFLMAASIKLQST